MTDRDFDEPEETPEDGDSPILTLEDVAVVIKPDQPITDATAYGALVDRDGTVYDLCRQWYHGVVLAVLEPEKTKAAGWDAPRRDCNVYKYQRLQFDIFRKCRYVFVSTGILGINVSRPEEKATRAQAARVVEILCAVGVPGDSLVATDVGEMEVNDIEKFLRRSSIYAPD